MTQQDAVEAIKADSVPVSGSDDIARVGTVSSGDESIGKLIAMAETGSQQGFQEAMGQMKDVMNLVLSKAAVAGGRGDRLISTKAAITNQIYSQEEGLSSVEDIDITELMAKLSMQQTAYNAALKSSSMIMQMSLVNFL